MMLEIQPPGNPPGRLHPTPSLGTHGRGGKAMMQVAASYGFDSDVSDDGGQVHTVAFPARMAASSETAL